MYLVGSDAKLVSVDVKAGSTLEKGIPKVLFQTGVTSNVASFSNLSPYLDQYCVTSDGQRFLLIEPVKGKSEPIHVILNWFEELKRLVPTEN